MIGEVATVIRTGQSAYAYAKKKGLVRRVHFLVAKKHHVVVLGSTGVGKTNFLKSLTDPMPGPIGYTVRTAFSKNHDLFLDRRAFRFVDTPGQVGHRTNRTQAIADALPSLSKKRGGVINVVCDGYHEYSVGPHAAVVQGAVGADYLDRHRAVEVKALEEWLAVLGEITPWLITLVTKADLWWDRHDDVVTHYQSGDYGRALHAYPGLSTAILPYSSVSHRFYGQIGMSGHFDDEDRKRTRASFRPTSHGDRLMSGHGRAYQDSPEPRPPWLPDLVFYVRRLARTTRLLQLVGISVLAVTLINFLVVAFQAQNYLTLRRDRFAYVETLPMSIICVAFVFLLVAFHEYMYRSALSNFEELSEELQSVRSGAESSSGDADADERWSRRVGPPLAQRDVLGLRIVLRDFGRSGGLPIFPRSSAPTIFIVLNLVLMTLGLFLVP